MTKRLITWLTLALVLCVGAGTSVYADTSGYGFTEKDKEYYLTEAQLIFIRPGLEFELLDFEIPDDRQPLATFSIKDPGGLPLDLDGVFSPGPVDIRFMLSYIPEGEENKINYHDRLRDRDGVYTMIEDGVYSYKFSTVLPEDFEMDATHTLASIATRDLRDDPWNLERYYDNDIMHFVPSGASEPMPRDIVTTATCNRCHDPLGEHGGRYQEVQACTQCHNNELVNDDSGLSYSLGPLAHRLHSSNEPEVGTIHYPAIINDCEVCHTGGIPTDDFPMVASPNPAPMCDKTGAGQTTLTWDADAPAEVRIDAPDGKLFASSGGAGEKATGKWVKDGRTFFLVNKDDGEVLQELEVNTSVFGCVTNAPGTFRGEAGDWHTHWMTRPSRDDCGSCHVNINWETGEGHVAGPQEDDEFCSFCHQADSGNEFDRSVRGAHKPLYKSKQLGGGLLVTLMGVNNTGPGQSPTVMFSLTDSNGPVNPAMLGRLRFTLTGPNEDFDFYVQENANNLEQVGDNWRFTFNAKVPMDAEGSYSVGVEGRMDVVVDAGNEEIETEKQIRNYIVPAAVTDTAAVPRRMVVDDAKCENCHANLSLHGENRRDATGYCQTCHRADETDGAVRLEGEDQSIHFKYMVHKIHTGADLENGYLVYGYRSSIHDYSDVHYVGDRRNCEACHVDDSYNLPLPEGVLATYTPADVLNPTEPAAAACLSCHDGFEAAAHASANTGAIGESCGVCHGPDKSFSVERVHAR